MGKEEKNRLKKIYRDSKLKAPYTKWSFARRFWVFQNERVPLLALLTMALSLTVALAVIDENFDWSRVLTASFMIVLYFLQIRLADEPKDYEHDNRYYPQRPVQRGVITLNELSTLKNMSVGAFLLLAGLTFSWTVFLLAVFQQFYSYLTRQEFFVRDWLRKHFLTYQFSHYVQLFTLSWLILTVLQVDPVSEKLIYFAYVMLMIGMVEASRTIGGTDKHEAQDRYSYRLGINVALFSFAAFVAAVIACTVYLISRAEGGVAWYILGLGIVATAWAIIKYKKNPITKNAEIMNAASLVMYLCSALTLLFSR